MLTIFKHRSLVKVGQDTLRLLWVICANILHLLDSVIKRKRKASIWFICRIKFLYYSYIHVFIFIFELKIRCMWQNEILLFEKDTQFLINQWKLDYFLLLPINYSTRPSKCAVPSIFTIMTLAVVNNSFSLAFIENATSLL